MEMGWPDLPSKEGDAVQAPAPELILDPIESETEILLQPKQLQEEMRWIGEFTSSLDAEIRHNDPEQVVSKYLREPFLEQGEGEHRPTEEPIPILIEDTDEEDPSTPDIDAYQPYEKEDPQEQEGVEPEEGQDKDEEEEQDGAEDQEEAKESAEAKQQDEEEAPDEAKGQDEEAEGEDEIEVEIEIEVEVEVDVDIEEKPEEAEEEEEWPPGNFEDGEEGELIGPQGDKEGHDDDEMEDEEVDSEASTSIVTNA